MKGRLAQLVQSICLTSRGSAVRIRQRPPFNREQSWFAWLLFLFSQPTQKNTLLSRYLKEKAKHNQKRLEQGSGLFWLYKHECKLKNPDPSQQVILRSLPTFNFQLFRGGLLYKTYFFGSKDIRNSINVNPLFRPQKGTFSSFLSVFPNYDRPLCHYDRANR